jgi:hypothetical protein
MLTIVTLGIVMRPSIDYHFGEGDPCESGIGFRIDFGCYRDTHDGEEKKGHFLVSAGVGTQLYFVVLRFNPDALPFCIVLISALLIWNRWRRLTVAAAPVSFPANRTSANVNDE